MSGFLSVCDDKPFRRGHRIDRISVDKPVLSRASREIWPILQAGNFCLCQMRQCG